MNIIFEIEYTWPEEAYSNFFTLCDLMFMHGALCESVLLILTLGPKHDYYQEIERQLHHTTNDMNPAEPGCRKRQSIWVL